MKLIRHLCLRLDPAEYDAIKEAAEACEESLNEWCRNVLMGEIDLALVDDEENEDEDGEIIRDRECLS